MLRGQKDTTVGHYDIYNNAKTGESFLINKTRTYELSENYSSVSSSDAKFGKTVLRFANSANKVQHGAVYYGTSKDGTVYVYTKNGWELKPTVMKLSDLMTGFSEYGSVQGIKTGESGYYDYKQR